MGVWTCARVITPLSSLVPEHEEHEMATITLTKAERTKIAKDVRRELAAMGHDAGFGIDDATALIETRVEALGRFDALPYTEISDYSLSFARFVCSAEARVS